MPTSDIFIFQHFSFRPKLDEPGRYRSVSSQVRWQVTVACSAKRMTRDTVLGPYQEPQIVSVVLPTRFFIIINVSIARTVDRQKLSLASSYSLNSEQSLCTDTFWRTKFADMDARSLERGYACCRDDKKLPTIKLTRFPVKAGSFPPKHCQALHNVTDRSVTFFWSSRTVQIRAEELSEKFFW